MREVRSTAGLRLQILSPEGPGSVSQRRVPIHAIPTEEPPLPDFIHLESALVEVPVHRTNALGATVAGLGRGDFELWEDGVRLPITYFSMDDAPASVGPVYDSSGSMLAR